ncbi:3-dehydroquinate synthase [Novosphingobium album (ex Liu et al. 2023)]|uniref:3-dehydroquinate synthase n=1 Tax=Novosphingobium album (ex Liu et al. 2023) TaxID=3031130 RepID=A0ABT5WWX7_9SPHN|nr:3-dehydroquinate synthase [Novosphingobium album (ex Liu et al. 2023)]MDE8654359.1 3-dehydroquinate synthase [Novosphingobium album (ex Liu et al. 2023)]
MAVIPVDVAGRPYEVRVGAGLLAELVPHCRGRLRKRDVPIVTDAHVHQAWGNVVEQALRDHGHEPHWRILPPGEATKSWDELAATVNWLLALEVERGDHVIALGGGVIGDLTGFAAAIVKRGCHFIQLPTSLLAQVDSSVGGKTAINTPAGKNLVGAFHQPALVLADLAVLDTLPDRELRAGYAEVVKYGLIGDADFLAWCEENGEGLLAGDGARREYAVAHSVAAKARIVAEDERETSGRRALLNLGHTFGHALEAETGFSDRLLHGEAVALGMVLAARYSARRELMPQASAERVATHIAASGLPSEIARLGLACDGKALVRHMLHDKKMDAGTLPFVLMRGIGHAFLDREVSLDDVAFFLDYELSRDALD